MPQLTLNSPPFWCYLLSMTGKNRKRQRKKTATFKIIIPANRLILLCPKKFLRIQCILIFILITTDINLTRTSIDLIKSAGFNLRAILSYIYCCKKNYHHVYCLTFSGRSTEDKGSVVYSVGNLRPPSFRVWIQIYCIWLNVY